MRCLELQNSTTDLSGRLLHAVGRRCHHRCLPAPSRCDSSSCHWSVFTEGGRDVTSRCRCLSVLRHRRSKLSHRGRTHHHPGSVDRRRRLRHGRVRARRVRCDPGGGGDRTYRRRVPDRCRWARRAHRGTVRDRRRSAVGDGSVRVALPVTTCIQLCDQ